MKNFRPMAWKTEVKLVRLLHRRSEYHAARADEELEVGDITAAAKERSTSVTLKAAELVITKEWPAHTYDGGAE